MQIEVGISLFLLLVTLYGAVGVLLGRWSITMPMVFVAAGVVLGPHGLGAIPIAFDTEAILHVTELTLAILLFADASTLRFRTIETDLAVPTRLLSVGMLLTLALGGVVAYLMFPMYGVGFALLLASILTPTDAALGLPIFTNPSVPVRIRRALNVESGLNDGIATPFVTLFLALAVAEADAAQGGWLRSAVQQIGIAALVGTAVGLLGGKLLEYTHTRGWTTGTPLQVAVLALALVAYHSSIGLGGNGFVAAFVAGIAFGVGSRGGLTEASEFSETTGTLLSLVVWAIFGALFVVPALQNSSPSVILYALLSLTVIRMLPVFVALLGLPFRLDTKLLMGWFGPRGLASVVFGLMAVEGLTHGSEEADLLGGVVAWTILLSVLAHGLSAQPLAAWYARRLAAQQGDLPEMEDVPEVVRRQSGLLGHAPES